MYHNIKDHTDLNSNLYLTFYPIFLPLSLLLFLAISFLRDWWRPSTFIMLLQRQNNAFIDSFSLRSTCYPGFIGHCEAQRLIGNHSRTGVSRENYGPYNPKADVYSFLLFFFLLWLLFNVCRSWYCVNYKCWCRFCENHWQRRNISFDPIVSISRNFSQRLYKYGFPRVYLCKNLFGSICIEIKITI